VKEFEDDTPFQDAEGDARDAYRRLREKVNRAARQFKAYKEFPCSIVMADPHHTFVDIDVPEIVVGTMLGNVGYPVPIGVMPGPENQPRQVFTKGGKMVDSRRQFSRNTTISAIIILNVYPHRQRWLEIALDKRKKEFGRELTIPEFLEVAASVSTSTGDSVLRAVVYENPYARIPLDRNLFHGSFDERWGAEGKMIRRLYIGEDLSRIEAKLEQCDHWLPLQRCVGNRGR
jgi:hypothetical protein